MASRRKLKKSSYVPLLTREVSEEELLAAVNARQGVAHSMGAPKSTITLYLIKLGIKRGQSVQLSLATLYADYRRYCKYIEQPVEAYKVFISKLTELYHYAPRGSEPCIMTDSDPFALEDLSGPTGISDLVPLEMAPPKAVKPIIGRNKTVVDPKVRTKFKGVYKHYRRFKAKVWFKGKQKIVGVYPTARLAAEARDKYLVRLWGDLAKPHLNFPTKYKRYEYEILQDSI